MTNDLLTRSDWPKVCIIIVNYMNWRDTAECLETVFRNNYPNYQVVLVDNSDDEESLRNLWLWAEGKINLPVTGPQVLIRLTAARIERPISCIVCDDRGNQEAAGFSRKFEDASRTERSSLVIVHPGKNPGFAAGNNIGIRYGLSLGDCDYFLLLNNDTIVEPDFVFPLVETFEKESNVGLVGGLVRFYDRPHDVWFSSGRFHWYGEGVHSTRAIEGDEIVKSDFVTGCLMMVPRHVTENVGMLSEEYFLYGEDTDYSLRVLKAGYRNLDNHKSVIYHKGSKTTGSRFSKVKYYYSTRNRLYFHYKYYGRFDFILFAFLFLSLKVVRLVQFTLNGDREARRALAKGVLDFIKMRKKLSRRDEK